MEVWNWTQPVDRIWKVVSDSEKGTILVYNEKHELILEKKGLSKESVALIENNFFRFVADKLVKKKPEKEFNHNPMYA